MDKDIEIVNRNIESYFKIYNNFLSIQECKETVKALDEATDFQTHSYLNAYTEKYISYENDLSISYSNVPIKNIIMERVWKTIRLYLEELNFPWYDSWGGFTQIRFNRYDIGTEMRDHCDHIQSIFYGERKGVPILTVLGLLNDEFQGGEFVMWCDKKVELKTGDLVIFPSNFLYPHRVEPIIKGRRYSFVSWVW